MRFIINIRWEIEEGVPVVLQVHGIYAHSPEIKRGNPESWAPAEAVLEIEEVSNMRGTLLPAPVIAKLKDDELFLSAVEDRIVALRAVTKGK